MLTIVRCTRFGTKTGDEQILQGALDALSVWSRKNLLMFLPEKCKVLTLGNASRVDYYLNGKKLEHVNEILDLGIIVSNDLKPSKQCSRAAKKANSILGFIQRCFKRLDKRGLTILHKGLVRPHIDYLGSVWSPYYAKDVVDSWNSLPSEIVQKLLQRSDVGSINF